MANAGNTVTPPPGVQTFPAPFALDVLTLAATVNLTGGATTCTITVMVNGVPEGILPFVADGTDQVAINAPALALQPIEVSAVTDAGSANVNISLSYQAQ